MNSSLSLDVLIQQALETERQRQAAEADQREREQQARRDAARAELDDYLTRALPDLHQRFDWSYQFIEDARRMTASAHCQHDGVAWKVHGSYSHRQQLIELTAIGQFGPRSHKLRTRYGSSAEFRCSAAADKLETFQSALLAAMGRAQEAKAEDRRERAAEDERAHVEAERQARAAAEQAEQRQRAQQAEREHEGLVYAAHQEIEARVEAELARQRAALWRWPDGVTVTLYRVRWCTGGFTDDDGAPHFHYATDWTPTQILPNDTMRFLTKAGWVTITRFNMPTWEEVTIASMDELPDALRETQEHTIPGIREQFTYFNQLDQPNGYYFYADPDSSATVEVGSIPVRWLRERVDLERSLRREDAMFRDIARAIRANAPLADIAGGFTADEPLPTLSDSDGDL